MSVRTKLHRPVSAVGRIVWIIQTSGSGSVVTWHGITDENLGVHPGTEGLHVGASASALSKQTSKRRLRNVFGACRKTAALTRLARRQKIDEAMECIKQVRQTGNAVDLRTMKPLGLTVEGTCSL